MSGLRIPWAPRVLLTGRTFRLPVQAEDGEIELETDDFRIIASRWSPRDSACYYYLRAPEERGDYKVRVYRKGHFAEVTTCVRSLDDLRRPHEYKGVAWPRRWPLGQLWRSTKSRQTLQDFPEQGIVDESLVAWWMGQIDETIWSQLPPAELPKAHFVNVRQGCPRCGTAVFRFGGFYPWKRNHLPCDFQSECPSCGAHFPSNDLAAGDFTSGECVDDGFGYFDDEGHLFLFAATYHRDQVRAYEAGIRVFTSRLRTGGFHEGIARTLGVMLLRQAVEEMYVAAVPQFRYGPSKGVEEPWEWGQPDWAGVPDPVAALAAKGTLHYCIDIPYVSETFALAYDTIWPFLREDQELVSRTQRLGLRVERPEDVVMLIEEMLSALLQCTLDRGARSNLPRESQGALVLLRGLDRSDVQQVMDWLYDSGPDRLRVFATNDFSPDGAPPEATGGYNSIHTDGLFALEYHLRELRRFHLEAYPESRFPSLMGDPRAARVARQPHEIMMIGKSWFQFGDGTAPGCKDQWTQQGDSLVLAQDVYHAPMHPKTLKWAAEFTEDPVVKEIFSSVTNRRHRRIGTTIHDGMGIAILRTDEVPERAAVGIVYGDTTGHRHMDLLDVQFFAFQRPFLTDLGYPQSWATIEKWEGHWATHNTVWGIIPGVPWHRIAGRGKLLRTLLVEGLQILDIEAERWTWDDTRRRWYRPGVTFRRLIALVETDGEGVAVVDLSRVRGGMEHWRVCRGLEGTFATEDVRLVPRSGTIADPKGRRGEGEGLVYPDYEGLACMDDIASGEAMPAWKGSWQSRREPAVHLDLHQIRVSSSTEVITARATAVMGTPEESSYTYRTLLWRRHPADAQETTCVDLVLEPRVGEATLVEVRALEVTGSEPTASGVELVTQAGKKVAIYWAPEAGPEDLTAFSDGTELWGSLAAVMDGQVVASGTTAFYRQGKRWQFEGAEQRGRIVGFDRQACTIDVEGLKQVKGGDRIRINPDGRGHNYRVEGMEVLGDGRLRLKLDVTSVLGRAPVVSAGEGQVELGTSVMTRTGNLNQTRLLVEGDGTWTEIAEAANQVPERTTLWLDECKGNTERIHTLAVGAWVSVVDYVLGDIVAFEPVKRGGGKRRKSSVSVRPMERRP